MFIIQTIYEPYRIFTDIINDTKNKQIQGKKPQLNNSGYYPIDYNDIVFVKRCDHNGIYTDITNDIIPEVDRAAAKCFDPTYASILDQLAAAAKMQIALIWGKYGSMHIMLDYFLPCAKHDMCVLLDMIKQYSGDIPADLEKIRFTIEYLRPQAKSEAKLLKCKEYLFNSAIYQEYFGSAAAEEAAAGEPITLFELQNQTCSQKSTKTQAAVYSRDFLIACKDTKNNCLYIVYRLIYKILLKYFDGEISAEKLTSGIIYYCNDRGGVINTYRIKTVPGASDSLSLDKTIILVGKAKRGVKFDYDTETKAIIELYNAQKAAPAENTEAAANTETTAAAAENTAAPETPKAPAEARSPENTTTAAAGDISPHTSTTTAAYYIYMLAYIPILQPLEISVSFQPGTYPRGGSFQIPQPRNVKSPSEGIHNKTRYINIVCQVLVYLNPRAPPIKNLTYL